MSITIDFANMSAIISTGPAHTNGIVAPQAIFSQDKATQAQCSHSTQACDNAGLRKNGPRPEGLRPLEKFYWEGHAALLVVHLPGKSNMAKLLSSRLAWPYF